MEYTEIKHCGSCHTFKKSSLFRKNKNRYDGLDGMCKECRNTKARKRYKINPEPKRAYMKNRNSLGYAKYNRKYYLKRKETGKKRATDLNRRALKKNAKGKITKAIIQELLLESNGLCFYCKQVIEKYHIDHYIPLSKGGSNEKSNLKISCPTCNLKKGSKIL